MYDTQEDLTMFTEICELIFNRLECLSIDSEDGLILNSNQLSQLGKILTPTLRHLEICVDTSAESLNNSY
ncbi:unnamed protein product [Rhizophagus irregularis]|nr:unnamed protein product [Rhizophagus irregularis]